ncbi:MAG: ThiF family adenylyltransferase [Sphingobacteriaceae bacterium]|nr:ThiF family adenylyltransferase [Sphingobacteriaceae bacterium]
MYHSDEYYEITDFRQKNKLIVSDIADAKFSVSNQLYTFIAKQVDRIQFINFYQEIDSGIIKAEHIKLIVKLDGLPTEPSYDIRYYEILDIMILCDDDIPYVFMLRKDFPDLIHQNQMPRNAPKNLCLYFEPKTSILRTWTAKSFFDRIIGWLEKSSIGELHATDQPVENLFYETTDHLVLPAKYKENAFDYNSSIDNYVSYSVESKKHGKTYILDKTSSNVNSEFLIINFITNVSQQGTIKQLPKDIYAFHEMMMSKSESYLNQLEAKFLYLKNKYGNFNTISKSTNLIIIIVDFPISRSNNSEIEKIQRFAFLVKMCDFISYGISLDIIQQIGSNLVMCAIINKENNRVIAVQDICSNLIAEPLSISYKNDISDYKKQSGGTSNCKNAIIIGVGSLGASLIDTWLRSGWNKWIVIDSDIISPHNLTRHIACQDSIGVPKTELIKNLSNDLGVSELIINTYEVDALEFFANPENLQPIIKENDVSFVLDVSTSIDVPRKLSMIYSLPRVISTFITPSGNSSVILIESENKTINVISLESQYYRAIISESWGENHLNNHLGTFWSGAGCRDISVVLGYDKIKIHSGILANQMPKLLLSNDAAIKVINYSEETGETNVNNITIAECEIIKKHGFDIYIDAATKEKLNILRSEKLPNETGGIVVGFYDFNLKVIAIVDVLSEPNNSESTPNWFQRSNNGISEKIQCIMNSTANIIGYIGEWHSHPQNVSSQQSELDIKQMKHIANLMDDENHPIIQIIISDYDISIYSNITKN